MAARVGLPATEEHKTRDTVATFIAKVWKIVENPDYGKYIHWSDVSRKGTSSSCVNTG